MPEISKEVNLLRIGHVSIFSRRSFVKLIRRFRWMRKVGELVKPNQKIVMDEELVQNIVMDEKLVQNIVMGEEFVKHFVMDAKN